MQKIYHKVQDLTFTELYLKRIKTIVHKTFFLSISEVTRVTVLKWIACHFFTATIFFRVFFVPNWIIIILTLGGVFHRSSWSHSIHRSVENCRQISRLKLLQQLKNEQVSIVMKKLRGKRIYDERMLYNFIDILKRFLLLDCYSPVNNTVHSTDYANFCYLNGYWSRHKAQLEWALIAFIRIRKDLTPKKKIFSIWLQNWRFWKQRVWEATQIRWKKLQEKHDAIAVIIVKLL